MSGQVDGATAAMTGPIRSGFDLGFPEGWYQVSYAEDLTSPR